MLGSVFLRFRFVQWRSRAARSFSSSGVGTCARGGGAVGRDPACTPPHVPLDSYSLGRILPIRGNQEFYTSLDQEFGVVVTAYRLFLHPHCEGWRCAVKLRDVLTTAENCPSLRGALLSCTHCRANASFYGLLLDQAEAPPTHTGTGLLER